MKNVAVYNQSGKKVEDLELPENIFNVPWNSNLVHQVVESERSNQRERVAHVKMRGEVSGGGKKPWQQKGTGRARHGSIRSPLWRKGGVTHGPQKERIFTKKINKKMAMKALHVVLSRKLQDKEILFMDTLQFDNHKTKNAISIFRALSHIKGFERCGVYGGKTLILAPKYDKNILQAMKNLKPVSVREAIGVTALNLLSYKYILIPKDVVAVMSKKIIKK